MKKLLIIFLLLAPIAQAAIIYPLPNEESFFAKVWRCKWHISCYQKKLGATLTDITSATLIKDYPAIQNTNNANVNAELLGVLTPARLTATSTSATSTIQWGLEVYQRPIAVGLANATTTIRGNATSSFTGGISTTATLDIQSTSATSTFSNGIRLINGCITMPDGTCALTSAIAGSGSTNQVAYFSAATTIAGDTDFTRDANGFIATNGTTTNATSTSLQVSGLASTSQMIIGALGVGVATTTQRNIQVAGSAQITGSTTIAGGLNVKGTEVGGTVFLATPVNSVDSITLTAGTFTNIDISATTTAGDFARFVIINAEMRVTHTTCDSGDGAYLRFRQGGSSVTANLPRLMVTCQTGARISAGSGMFVIPLNTSQIFQYDASLGPLSGDSPDSVRYLIDTVGYIK